MPGSVVLFRLSVVLSHPPLFLNWPGLTVVVPLVCHGAVGALRWAVWCL